MNERELARRGYAIGPLRSAARRRLPRVLFDFCDGGAEDERTRDRNELDFARYEIVPRMLTGGGEPDLTIELFGRRLAMPVLIGPTGGAGMIWPDGEILASRAAAAAGTVYVQSHGSTCTIEELAAGGGSSRWYQAFLYRDRGLSRSLIERAQAAGAEALVLTVDNQVLGQRERDLRNGFTIPPRITAANVCDMALRLPWLWRMRKARIRMANYEQAGHGNDIRSLAAYISEILDPTIGWAEVDWVRSLWRGPFLLKGILHPADAKEAIRHGVDGIIVSNHGGRQLDGAISSAAALPGVVAAVGGKLPVLVDGGIRRGSHVLVALALGATACLIGRPHWWGLAVAGEAGVAHVLSIYRRELARAMGLAGIRDLASIPADLLRGRVRLAPPATAPAEAPLRAAE